jgi:hypothetical protein
MSMLMCMITKGISGIVVLWLLATFIPTRLFGAEAAHPAPGASGTPADFVLTVHEGLLSLQAQDASLKEIVEASGLGMGK